MAIKQIEIVDFYSFIAVDGDRIGVLLDVNPKDLNASSFIEL